jgi:hypothetical protein
LAADVTTSSEPRLKIRKGKYWVRESINLRFLKPPIVSNSCFANWEQKATSGYSFICCYFNKFSNQPELYFLLNPLWWDKRRSNFFGLPLIEYRSH